jgi:hypothetical protein
MRLTALRTWMHHAVSHSVTGMRRIGKAVTKRIRPGSGRIEIGSGVGDEESRFGGSRTQVWFEDVLEDTRNKLRNILEHSFFERFPKLERLMRKVLGDRKPDLVAPPLQSPKKPIGPLGARVPTYNPEAERYKAQIRKDMAKAHTQEHAGLRASMDRRRRRDTEEDDEPL